MQQKAKIALIGPIPPPNGGMAMQGKLLTNLLTADGYQVSYIPTNYQLPKILDIKYLRAIIRFFIYNSMLWRIGFKVKVFHILANSGLSWYLYAIPAIMIGKILNKKVIVNYRGGKLAKFLSSDFSRVAFSFKAANKIIVPSPYLQEVFQSYKLTAKIIPNILSNNMLQINKSIKNKFNQNQVIKVVVTRNLEQIYDVQTAIKAIKIVKDKYANIQLLVAGDGPLRMQLQDLIEQNNLTDNVKLLGRLNREEIINLYQQADISINPSLVDNMPNSVLESLAAKVPVVSTNVGGVPYIVEHQYSALLVEPANEQQMATAVLSLLEDPQLYKKLVNGGAKTAKLYTWEQVGPKWRNLYDAAN